jgi:hypothetical protein
VGVAGDEVARHNEAASIVWEDDLHLIYPERASYPRVTELVDGTVLATFAHTTPEGRAIACVLSSDGGRSWGKYHRIYEQRSADDLDNAFPLQLPNGTILVACRHHARDHHIYRIEVYSSANGGAHWDFLSTIVTGHTGLWEPFILLQPDGNVQAYYASEEGCSPDQRIEMRTSSDGGKSWEAPVVVAQKKGSRDGMPGVVRLHGNELLAVFEAQDVPPFRFVIEGVRSTDNGKTWSANRELIYRPNNPVASRWAAGAPSIIRLDDNRLLVSFQSDEQVQFVAGDSGSDPQARGYNYLRHAQFAYVASPDNGASWAGAVHLVGSPEHSACWNSLYLLRNGKILATTNYHGRIWTKVGNVKPRI